MCLKSFFRAFSPEIKDRDLIKKNQKTKFAQRAKLIFKTINLPLCL